MPNNKSKPGLEVAEKISLAIKVALVVGMVSAFLVGAVLVSSLFPQPSVVTNQTTKKEKTTVIAKKYATSVDLAEFSNSYSIPSDETKGILGINGLYDKDTVIPLKIKGKIIGLSVDAEVTLKNNLSFARVILVDKNNNEYLVSDTSFPFEELTELKGVCEETCQMDSIIPSYLKIELSKEFIENEKGEIVENDKNPTASIEIFNINYLIEGKLFKKDITSDKTKISQQALKVKSFNSKGRNWVAGETDVSKLSYSEKKKLFGGKLPNLCGFEYYQGGYFEFCEKSEYAASTQNATTTTTTKTTQIAGSSTPFSFDWRNRHGQNWMTSVKNQLSCGSCWAFSSVGAVEAAANLYFNQHINPDLSEQDLVSCSGGGSCDGGVMSGTLTYIKNTGVADEACFPYTATNNFCANKCVNWLDRIWKISGHGFFHNSIEVKNALVEKGPLAMSDIMWRHAIVLAGFGEVTAGTYYATGGSSSTVSEGDPLIGATYWLIKNSWGASWGENGYAKMIYSAERFDNYNTFYSMETPITPPPGASYEVICKDSDSDGYCFWGVGANKPSTCPGSCAENNISDLDDSDSLVGARPEYFVCGNHSWLASGEVGGPFGYYTGYGYSSCCGDSLNEYPVGDRCCNSPLKILKAEGVLGFSFKWGSQGSGNGQFNTPNGIAISNDRVYVADVSNHRIQVFDLNGQYLNQWGSLGNGNGQFNIPAGVAVNNNQVYVTDSSNHRIQVFDASGNFITKWGSQGTGNGQLYYPEGIAINNNNGYVYVADLYNHRIQVFDLNGQYLNQWGSLGNGNGQFEYPKDIAVNNNQVYVADSNNDRIQVFDLNGQYLNQWGSWGIGNGQFQALTGIAINSSQVYATDSFNQNIQVFDLNGQYLNQWGSAGSGNGQFQFPRKISINNSGDVYVTDSSNHRVQVFSLSISSVCRFDPQEIKIKAGFSDSPENEIGNKFAVPLFSTVYFKGAATDYGQSEDVCDGCIFEWSLDSAVVSNSDSYHVVFNNENTLGEHQLKLRVTDSEGNFNEKNVKIFVGFMKQWGSPGSGNGQFNKPAKIAISTDNDYVYVADSSNHRIQVFDQNGNFQFSWGSYGSGNGQFSSPYDLDIFGNKVYITEMNNHRIQVFDLNGQYLNQWGSYGLGNGQFRYPLGIAINNNNGYVYVADLYNDRIQVFDQNGNFQFSWGSSGSGNGQFKYPQGISVSNGRVYVTESGGSDANQRVQVFDASNGNFIFSWGYRGTGNGQFDAPQGIFVANNKVYVADTGNNRIQQFDANGTFINKWGSYGTEEGEFDSPTDISFYLDRVYVADRLNSRIQIFGPHEPKCYDGTLYGYCNASKQYCDNGTLVDRCTTCGCPSLTPHCNSTTEQCESVDILDLISLPVRATYTCHSLVSQTSAKEVNRWRKDTQSWESCANIGGGIIIGEDFPIELGNGYFVRRPSNIPITFTGDPITSPIPLDLKIGLNLISIPYSAAPYTCYTLLDELSSTAVEVNHWNIDTQSWEACADIGGGVIVGTDFPIEPDKGYFVRVISETELPYVPGHAKPISSPCQYDPEANNCGTRQCGYNNTGCYFCGNCPSNLPYCNTSGQCEAKCSDGTPFNKCSSAKPKYCNNQGKFIDSCLSCGCPRGQTCKKMTGYPAGKCISTGEPPPSAL